MLSTSTVWQTVHLLAQEAWELTPGYCSLEIRLATFLDFLAFMIISRYGRTNHLGTWVGLWQKPVKGKRYKKKKISEDNSYFCIGCTLTNKKEQWSNKSFFFLMDCSLTSSLKCLSDDVPWY